MKQNYRDKGPIYCSKLLKRTYTSVSKKATKLNLKYQKYIQDNQWVIENIAQGVDFCSKKLNCSHGAIRQRLKRLGLSKTTTIWTNDHTTFLIKNYPILGAQECQLKLKRPMANIYDKAYKLGLTPKKKSIYIIGTMHQSFWTHIKCGTRGRNLIITITPSDVWQLFLDQDKKCLFCNDIISLDLPITGSLDRIDNKIGYVLNNIQFLCIPCNMMKGRYTDTEFIKQAIKISNNFN